MPIIRDNTLIWIVPKDTDPSTLLKSSGVTPALEPLKGTITNYNKSGGESSVEATATFGGDIQQRSPRDAFEVSFEIVTSVDNLPTWANFTLVEDGNNAGIYTTRALPDDVAVYIEANDGEGTPTYYSWGFNNCPNATWDIDHAAEENQTGTLSFSYVSTTEDGTPNQQEGQVEVTSLPDWTTLEKA